MTQTNHHEALRYDITFGAFSNPLLKAILRRFGQTAFARSSACMEFETFLKRIGARGRTCLEIGTYHGISAVVLSQYFERVICVSVDDRPRKLMKRNIVNFLEIKNIEFHDVPDNVTKAEVIKGLDFDFCYSDGDHVNDTYTDFAMVKHCGRVLLHEAWVLQPPVFNLACSLPADEVTWADTDCFAYWERRRG